MGVAWINLIEAGNFAGYRIWCVLSTAILLGYSEETRAPFYIIVACRGY